MLNALEIILHEHAQPSKLQEDHPVWQQEFTWFFALFHQESCSAVHTPSPQGYSWRMQMSPSRSGHGRNLACPKNAQAAPLLAAGGMRALGGGLNAPCQRQGVGVFGGHAFSLHQPAERRSRNAPRNLSRSSQPCLLSYLKNGMEAREASRDDIPENGPMSRGCQ